MTIGERIRQRRKELGLSQEQLAIMAGFKEKTSICKLEKSRFNPTISTMERIAKVLTCSPSWLVGWSDVEPPMPVTVTKEINKDNYVKVVIKGHVKTEEIIPVKIVLKED